MSIEPKTPIGKAVDGTSLDVESEVEGHSQLSDRVDDPATSEANAADTELDDTEAEVQGHRGLAYH